MKISCAIPLLLTTFIFLNCSKLEPKHQESGLNSSFRYEKKPFHEYVIATQNDIRTARRQHQRPHTEQIVRWNSPFECLPEETNCPGPAGKFSTARYKNGILLVHGLTDSPFLMRDLARAFHAKGFLVRALLLPGHGTTPGDLLAVTYEEWLQAVRYGLKSFHNRVDNLYMAGYSTGGALGVYLALQNELHSSEDAPVKALFIFSPAIQINTSIAFMANWHKILSWAAPAAKWLDLREDTDAVKYESFPNNGVDQIHLLTKVVQELFEAGRTLSLPLFVAMSEDDGTVRWDKSLEFFRSQKSSPHRRLLLYGNAPDAKDDGLVRYIPARTFGDKIVSFAHVSLTMAPDNAHYGENGAYRYCMHYRKNARKRKACLADSINELVFGETTQKNLENYPLLRRLTYNPDFEGMFREMERFIEKANLAAN